MKYILSLLCLTLPWMVASAVNPHSDVKIKRLQQSAAAPLLAPLSVSDNDPFDGADEGFRYYPVILELEEGTASSVIDELEAVVYHSRENLYLTSIPIENLDRIPGNGAIINYHVASKSTPNLDVARSVSGVDRVQTELKALDFDHSETKVVTGICDVGFDPRHPAFEKCLKRWVIYDEFNGTRREFDGYDDIVNNGPDTDDADETHATHVGNILAGGSTSTPYYGVAPNTDFVATVSRLSDVGLCAGIEDIVAYAKEVNKPAVVNLSLANFTGPHDGTDLVGRYLTALSEDAVICFSAGNFGDFGVSITFSLDDYIQPVGSSWCDMSWLGFNVDGTTDLWSFDDKAFEFRISVNDCNTHEIVYVSDWMGAEEMQEEYHLDLSATPWFEEGDVWAAWGVNDTNGRFSVSIDYDYKSTELFASNVWARYWVGFYVRKIIDNTEVFAYCDGVRSFFQFGYMVNGVGGNSEQSINNLATSPGVIAVGAWTSRNQVPDTRLGTIDWGSPLNTIARWSSHGTTVDGRTLPHFSAPGAAVVSAMSAPYAELNQNSTYPDNVAYDKNGEKYLAMQGTSMASPFATGVLALWLEANPSLTKDELLEVAENTANKDFADIKDPRWGAGAIDAYAGLRRISDDLNGVESAVVDGTRPFVYIAEGRICCIWVQADNPLIEVFDLQGRRVRNDNLQPGSLYVVRVSDPLSGKSYNYKLR